MLKIKHGTGKWSWQNQWEDWSKGWDQDIESLSVLIRTKLWAQILLAMILGLAAGLMISPQGGGLLSESDGLYVASWLKLPGAVFLNLIQMVVIPLVTSSIILGICSSGDPAYLRRVGLRIFPYFVVTTTVAVVIGVWLTLQLQPGNYIDQQMIVQLASQGADTAVVPAKVLESKTLPERLADLIPTNIEKAMVTMDMLQIVIYAIICGVALVALPKDKSETLLKVLQGMQELSLKIVGWAMMLAPYAVFGLLADIAIRVGLEAIVGMSAYVGTVILGLVMLLAFYLLVATLLGKIHPIKFLCHIREVQLLAFSTSSSAAVMPLSMQTAEEKLAVKPAISRFIVPLGATVNMDGTALYQVVAALFLTQVFGIELTTGQIVLLTATTVGASIGSPSTPGVGIVILATILTDIGVPASGIALIIGVDRILDMCRTSINVSGDLTACTVMNHWLENDAPEPAEKAPQPTD